MSRSVRQNEVYRLRDRLRVHRRRRDPPLQRLSRERIVKARARSLVTRQTLKPFLSVEKHQDLRTRTGWLGAGELTPVIDRTYRLSAAADALRYVGAGHTRGKVVITV